MTREVAIKAIQDFIGWFKEDSLIRKALEMAIKALEQNESAEEWYKLFVKKLDELEPCDDAISREAVIEKLNELDWQELYLPIHFKEYIIDELPSVTQKSGKWISVGERLPEDHRAVNITWVNHNPKEYYADVKDKPFTATGRYCNGQWWWDSVVCGDYLDEYGHSDCDAMDEYIEVIAWTPLPKPYEP